MRFALTTLQLKVRPPSFFLHHDDGYMAVLRLRGFGYEMPIRANFGEFLGILTPKIVKLYFLPSKVRTSRGDKRFEILRVKIGPAVFAVALFKY